MISHGRCNFLDGFFLLTGTSCKALWKEPGLLPYTCMTLLRLQASCISISLLFGKLLYRDYPIPIRITTVFLRLTNK